MLFHMSIAARNPAHVAGVIAKLWGGEALPFPPVSDDGWIALAGDARGTAMEVYPADCVLAEAEGDADAVGLKAADAQLTPTHAAIATDWSQDAVLALAKAEGWPAKYRSRGGMFGVIEMWVEGRQMLEVLTPEMQDEYLSSMTIDNWKALLAAGPPPAA